MKLCRTITLGSDRRLLHAVRPLLGLEEQSFTSLLAGPCKLPFDAYRLAALTHVNAPLGFNFFLSEKTNIIWSVMIVDDLEKRPLFAHRSMGQALLLTGELIDGLFEAFQSFGHTLTNVAPDPLTNHLKLHYEIAKDTSAKAAIGSAMCFVTIMNSLLFVRGLAVTQASVSMPEEKTFEHADFIDLYRYLLTETYEH